MADANGPEEQAMGWYYYLDDKIRFPFQAKCIAAKLVSPLRKGEAVAVQGMAPEDACERDKQPYGGALSVGNLSLGVLGGLSILPAIQPTNVPIAVGIVGSAYTGLAAAFDAVEKIGAVIRG
jgi:hypothetical protein